MRKTILSFGRKDNTMQNQLTSFEVFTNGEYCTLMYLHATWALWKYLEFVSLMHKCRIGIMEETTKDGI